MIRNLQFWMSWILFVSCFASAANSQEDLTGIKCVVRGHKSATPDASVEYKEGKVYFCCEGCADEFRNDVKLNDKALHTIKANHQLVLTGQYIQTACPMSAGAINDNLIMEVGGTKIGFCCKHCYEEVKNAENLEDKAKLLFTDSAFNRAFEKKKPDIDLTGIQCIVMPYRNVSAKQSVEYKKGKIYFCCKRCVKKFADAPEKFTTDANRQLVATGQYVQTGCPVTAGDFDDGQSTAVGGVSVKFCCDKCKNKIDTTGSDEEKVELVFGEERFNEAFSEK